MDLRERGRGDRASLEPGEELAHRRTELALDLARDRAKAMRRYGVLQACECLDIRLGHQVRTSGEVLTRLGEHAAQPVDRLEQARRSTAMLRLPEWGGLIRAQPLCFALHAQVAGRDDRGVPE